MIFAKPDIRGALKFWVSVIADAYGEDLPPESFAEHVEAGLRGEGIRPSADIRKSIKNMRLALFDVRRKCRSKD